ncbi:hypothetical protein APHAL10511_003053 [Amanita phalloides]|nr:hypothetical protein APHAL10511_003053 [Amanita phalloides]
MGPQNPSYANKSGAVSTCTEPALLSDTPSYIPEFYWKLRLSNTCVPGSGDRSNTVHMYDVYDNVLSEVQDTASHYPRCTAFHDFNYAVDPATREALEDAQDAFVRLERKAEEALEGLVDHIRSDGSCREIQVERCIADTLRRYFAFLRFRNSKVYKEIVHSVRELVDNQTPASRLGKIYPAYRPLISQLHLRIVLRTILAFLTSGNDKPYIGLGTGTSGSTTLLRRFHEAMEWHCWSLRNAEICFGVATEEQEFLLPDTCYGTLTENYQENPDCRDLFFPILPTVAVYLLGGDDDDDDGDNDADVQDEPVVTISVGIESAIDVHLRNAMILNTYPERLYFHSLCATTLTLSSYDEFRWIQEHQDYSRLKQRCRQKFLQQCVTKTLVVKGTLALLDLTDEVQLIGDSAVGFGSFSDVWKGLWRDQVEKREKKVAVKFLRKVMFREPREQLVKHLQAECVAWHRLCHRHVNQLYGLIQTPHSIGMVSQWCENGTITEYIAEHAVDKIKLLIQVASGMAYLHSCQPVVVHGDLKGANILIDEYGCVMISDFGLSKVMEGVDKRLRSSFAGSMRWMAPELIFALVDDEVESVQVSTHSDVYAFGAVCLEVVTGQLPFPHRMNDEAVLVDMLRGARPRRGELRGMDVLDEEKLWRTLERCWTDEQAERPGMAELVVFLRSVANR